MDDGDEAEDALPPFLPVASDKTFSGILKRKAALGSLSTFSFCSVMMAALAVIPGNNLRSGLAAVNKTV